MQRNGRKIREVGGDANLLSLDVYVLPSLLSQLSVFLKLCIMNTLLHFLLRQSCHSLRNVSLGSPHIPLLGMIKRSYHGWVSVMTLSEGPLFSLVSGPPTLSPPLATDKSKQTFWAISSKSKTLRIVARFIASFHNKGLNIFCIRRLASLSRPFSTLKRFAKGKSPLEIFHCFQETVS